MMPAKVPLRVLPVPSRIHSAKSRLVGTLYNILADQNLTPGQMSARTGAAPELLDKLFNGHDYDNYTFDQLIEYLYRADERTMVLVKRVHFQPGGNS